MHGFQLQLHLFSHLQIQSSQRFIKEQDIRLIDDGAGDRNPLLLAARQCGYLPLLKPLKIYDLQHFLHLFIDHVLREFLQIQPESYVVIDIEMREQRVALEHRVDRP